MTLKSVRDLTIPLVPEEDEGIKDSERVLRWRKAHLSVSKQAHADVCDDLEAIDVRATTLEASVTTLEGKVTDLEAIDHTQNTDQYLDYGGANQAAVVDVKSSVDLKHAEDHASRHKTGGADILYVPRTFIWFIEAVTVGTERGPTFRSKRALTIEDVELHVKTAPTGASLIVDIKVDGTTIFSTRPEIDASGTTEDDNHAFSTTAIAAGKEIIMNVDQIGSTLPGEDLTVQLHCKEAVI